MSASPVKRRESPWGLPEGETREPKPHRCNDRAEDIIYACFEGNPFKTVPGPFKLFWQCMRSKPGVTSVSSDADYFYVRPHEKRGSCEEEPTEPFFFLDLEPPRREVKLEECDAATNKA